MEQVLSHSRQSRFASTAVFQCFPKRPSSPGRPADTEDLTNTGQAWYYVHDTTRTQQGPCSVTQLGILFAASRVTDSTLVWSNGMVAWSPLSMVSSLYVQVTQAKIASRPRPLRLAGGGTHAVGGGAHAPTPASGAAAGTRASGEVQSLGSWKSSNCGVQRRLHFVHDTGCGRRRVAAVLSLMLSPFICWVG